MPDANDYPEASYENPVEEGFSSKTPEEDGAEKSACAVVIIILVVLILAGVGIWYYLTRRTPGVPPSKAPPKQEETSEEPEDTGLIRAAKGGTVVYKDSFGREAKIIVPAGALTRDTKIEIEWVASGRVTDLYHLKPDGLKFLKPVTVAIPYKESGLAEEETPYDIDLEYWQKGAYEDKELLDFRVDKTEKMLSTAVRSF